MAGVGRISLIEVESYLNIRQIRDLSERENVMFAVDVLDDEFMKLQSESKGKANG